MSEKEIKRREITKHEVWLAHLQTGCIVQPLPSLKLVHFAFLLYVHMDIAVYNYLDETVMEM